MAIYDKGRRGPPSSTRNDLTQTIIGVSIALAILTAIGYFVFGGLGFKETTPLVELPWILPLAQAFVILSAFAISFLCYGRFRALGGAWVFWTSVIFLANGILGVIYLLSWPGLLGTRGLIAELPNTSSWLFFLFLLSIPLLLMAVNARRPQYFKASFVSSVYLLAAVLAFLSGLLSVLFESSLPVFVVDGTYTPGVLVLVVALVILAVVAAIFAHRRCLKEQDIMLDYLALFLILMAFEMTDTIIGGKRYDFWWYLSRLDLVIAYVVVLFGLLQEGYTLLGRERMLVLERERLLEEVREARDQLETRVKERTADLAKANEELQRRAVELDVSNRELQSFAYSVAHDLRAPARQVNSYSQLLLQEYADRPLDERGKKYLQFLINASQKEGQLIDDLLELLNVARVEMHRQPVNLGEIAESILESFRKGQPDRKVGIRIVPEVVVQGDPQLLRIALENLLDNAWKFTSTRPVAKIEFGVTQQNGEPVYFVKDNGVGFKMAYVGKVFGAFQRLHRAEEFPGTGIGLAIVQRIVQRHGGTIWAEGEVDKGATFYFTLM